MRTCENCGNELRTCGKCGWSKVYEEDLGHLKQEVERLKADNKRLKEIDERECLIANSIRRDRDNWLRKAAENGKFYMDALQETEQLKAANAALLECVKWYAKFNGGGYAARECLAKIGGDADE